MNINRYLEKIAEVIYSSFHFSSGRVRKNIRVLNPGVDTGDAEKKYYIRKITACLKIGFAGLFISIVLIVSKSISTSDPLKRKPYGRGNRLITVEADINGKRNPVEVRISEQGLSKTETDTLSNQLSDELDVLILKDNDNLMNVTGDLSLEQEYVGYPFIITWRSDCYDVISSDGKLHKENIGEMGNEVTLTAEICYEDYVKEKKIRLHVLRQEESLTLYEALKLAVEQADIKTRTEPKLLLPDTVFGNRIQWHLKKDRTGIYLLAATLILSVGLFFFQDTELKKKTDARDWQLKSDYPELVSKLTLLIGAGMTVRSAWKKVANDYKGKKKEGSNQRYAYEEMILTCREIDDGISEYSAYENFGKRTGDILYMKFTGLLCRNLKRGASGLGEVLRQEASEAFEIRKSMAKQMGEKAGTKMLLPNGMLLAVVLVMVMIPAFWSF